jgi:hypothetical protein
VTPSPALAHPLRWTAGWVTALAAGALLAGATGGGGSRGAAADSAGGRTHVVVTGDRGERLAAAQLPLSGEFALAYQHSYYDVPAVERFRVTGAAFRLVSVSSPSEPVLDYYGLPGARSRTAAGHVLVPDGTAQLRELRLVASAKGRRTLVVGDGRFPLYPHGEGDGARHVVLRVLPPQSPNAAPAE